MKKYMPIAAIIVFILALLGYSNYIWTQQEAVRAERIREAERHLVVYSDMPADVNADLAKRFYERTHLRVQIQTKTDGEIQGDAKHGSSGVVYPDVVIAVQPVLQEEYKQGRLQAYASQATDAVPLSLKDADGYWTGLWVDPMVLIISQEYYGQHGLGLQTWESLLGDPEARIAFPDLAATDIAGDFLCSFVEVHGQDNSLQYFKNLQRHITAYSKSMSLVARRVASGESELGVVDAVTARQYVNDKAPLYILYPQDGTSYWLVGAAATKTCGDEELSGQFIDWLLSKEAAQILRKNHLYLNHTISAYNTELDAKGQGMVLFPLRKNYTEQGRKEMQDWWIKTVRFGKES
jgi:iron(III) transport system substrate-binding protein